MPCHAVSGRKRAESENRVTWAVAWAAERWHGKWSTISVDDVAVATAGLQCRYAVLESDERTKEIAVMCV